MIKEKEIKELKKMEGKVRGVTLLTDMDYIKSNKGEKGLEKFKQSLNKTIPELDLENIKNTAWYPVGYRILSLLIIKDCFDFSNKDIIDIGYKAPKISFVVKTLMRYFVSLEKTFKEASKYWKEHWTVGQLESAFIDLKERYLIIKIKGFKAHPVMCAYWKGYFGAIAELSLNNKKVTVEEKKCIAGGDDHHEFWLRW